MLVKMRWAGWLTLLIIGLLSFVIGKESLASYDGAKENVVKVHTSQKKTDLHPKIDMMIENKEANTFTSSFSIPITHSKAIDHAIKDWVKLEEDAFYKEMESNKDLLADGFRAHLNVQVEMVKITKNMFSFIFNIEQTLGEDNSYQTVKSFTVHMENQQVLALNDALNIEKINLDELITIVQQELEGKKKLNKKIDEKKLKEALHNTNDWKWSLSKEHFNLHFNSHEISDTSSQVLTIKIPLVILEPYLNNDISATLKIKEKADKIKKEEEERRKQKEAKKKQEEQNKRKSGKKYVAFTFDDGPSPDITPRILNILDEYDVQATFFMLGKQVDYYPEIARQVKEAGHQIGNHSVTHVDLTTVKKSRIESEIGDATDKIYQATKLKPDVFRPPYGAYNQAVINTAKAYNQPIIMWSVDSFDWKNKNGHTVYKQVMNEVHPGAIILMHDIHPSTADGLPKILKALKNEGYEFVTVSELLSLSEYSDVGPYNSLK